MTAPLPPGWYPDPSGLPGRGYFDGRNWTVYPADPPTAAPIAPRPSRRRIAVWAWIAVVVVLVIAGIVGDRLAGSKSQQTQSPSTTSSTTSPSLASTLAEPPATQPPPEMSPHSGLVDMALPRGSTRTGEQSVPGTEMWHVPLRVPDTVANLRPQLPINAPYDGLGWCAEILDLSGDTTRWSWGTAQDRLRIEVGPFYPQLGVRGAGSQVTITRHPDDRGGVGCR